MIQQNKKKLFEKTKIKLLESVVEFNHKEFIKHPHPSKLQIPIPINKFNNEELNYLRENESSFKYQDDLEVERKSYPCYQVDTEFIYTNAINLLGFKE